MKAQRMDGGRERLGVGSIRDIGNADGLEGLADRIAIIAEPAVVFENAGADHLGIELIDADLVGEGDGAVVVAGDLAKHEVIGDIREGAEFGASDVLIVVGFRDFPQRRLPKRRTRSRSCS